ncbi:hypothetical protein KIN20_012471 [Parelaphostrongylus tenuis]|nr:hypothetical protein KIN20_012471 [Parelaphostrongylus tenuis]
MNIEKPFLSSDNRQERAAEEDFVNLVKRSEYRRYTGLIRRCTEILSRSDDRRQSKEEPHSMFSQT